jgi:predicted transcriptional regulator
MLLPSEIEAKSLIPAVRSLLARKLTTEYDLKEEIVAKVLGVTQAAISNYVRGTRGDTQLMLRLSSTPQIMVMIEDIARDLATNKVYTPGTMAKFVELCNYMRYTFIICDVHHSIESEIDEQICEKCKGTLLSGRL